MFFKKIFFLSIVITSITACSSVHKGYKVEEDDKMIIQQLVSQKANINQIINKLGSPSFVNSPINDTLCYIDANGKKVAFNRFYRPNYQFLCIIFENQIAKEIKQASLSQIKKTKMIKFDTSFEKPL